MIDLYAAGTSNGLRARIALEECALDYRFHPIDLAKGENKSAAFLAMNPNGQIPVIIDHEGPDGRAMTLSQSTAILIYCAEKSGKFIAREPGLRPRMLQALMSGSTDISPVFGCLFLVLRSKEPHSPTGALLKDRIRGFFRVWDDVLGRQSYCVGDEATIADFSLYAAYARITGMLPELAEGLRHLARWGETMHARPAIQRALKF